MYFAFRATNPSAYVRIAEVKLAYAGVEDAYVPTAIVESNWAKKGLEREVTSREPKAAHVCRERYNCSAAAKVVRYQGCVEKMSEYDYVREIMRKE